MPTPRSSWVWVDMSPHLSAANATCTISQPVPVKGRIVCVRAGQKLLGAAASNSFTLAKGSANILSAASVDPTASFVAGVAEDLVLTTNEGTLKVATTDMLHAVYTLTTCALTSAIGVYLAIEPEEW